MGKPNKTDRLVETKLNKKNPQRIAEESVRVHLLFLNPSWLYLDPEEFRNA
ncbi:hypothetical protein LYNGBM3L_26020 [Moorena producens 3L]|uniref:Uncharacterized protein n=1 Tax=Moorena producens 3L TaxID=489825 RepID=F4XNX2_9CYAN|nr:hypothetical protein LYNGBM3L_26020 [Moorena producens 3L]